MPKSRTWIAFFAALFLVGFAARQAVAVAVNLPRCEDKIVWANPDPGTCVSVVLRVSMNQPDSLVQVTATGQDAASGSFLMTPGEAHHFLTKFDTIRCHELVVNVGVCFVID